jgi:hypothetical protein
VRMVLGHVGIHDVDMVQHFSQGVLSVPQDLLYKSYHFIEVFFELRY